MLCLQILADSFKMLQQVEYILMSKLCSRFGSKAPDVGPPAIEQSVSVSLPSMAEVEAAMPLATDINARFC